MGHLGGMLIGLRIDSKGSPRAGIAGWVPRSGQGQCGLSGLFAEETLQ